MAVPNPLDLGVMSGYPVDAVTGAVSAPSSGTARGIRLTNDGDHRRIERGEH
jgi:hypothetical protein